jgi:hypothetical protein
MSDLISNFLEPFSYFLYSVALFACVFYRTDFKKSVLLLYYIFASLIILYASLMAYYKTWGDNNWVYNLFFLITIVVLSYYFHQLLHSIQKKIAIRIVLIINLALFMRYDIVSRQFHGTYNNYVVAFCFLSIVVYSFLYFHQLVTHVAEQSLLLQFDFWLVTGYLLYFLGGFFAVLFYKNASIEQRQILWGLQNIILFISAVITLCGNLWVGYKRKLA